MVAAGGAPVCSRRRQMREVKEVHEMILKSIKEPGVAF